MRTKAATAVLALLALAATPAALAKGSVTIEGRLVAALQRLHVQVAPVALTKKDRMRSCQVGASRSRVPIPGVAGETLRNASTVACEQPTRGNLNLSAGLMSGGAAAVAAAG